jgi:hypothetical protein
MATHYQLTELAAMPVPSLTGRYLAHNQEPRVVRAFLAADLHRGVKQLTKPTLTQAAFLAGVNRTYAFWATRRQDERFAIEAGYVPLVPVAPARANGNGAVQPMPNAGIDDAQLMHIANQVGADRMLAAAIAAGH